MKKIALFILIFSFGITYWDNLNSNKIEFGNNKVQNIYNNIIGKIEKQLINLHLSNDSKQQLNLEILNINDNFLYLEKDIQDKDRINWKIRIENILNSIKKINDSIKKNTLIKIKNTLNDSTSQIQDSVSWLKYWELMYYADSFEWAHTSNWNIFSQKYFSAAKCSTPLNTFTQVIFNNKSLLVKVNDRPSCSRFPNLIDMSTLAFDFLAQRYQGTKKWEYKELTKVDSDYYKQYIPENFFNDSHVFLNKKIPNTYIANETFNLWGEILNNSKILKLIINYPSWKEIELKKVDVEKYFLYSMPLDEIWKYSVRFENSWNISKTFNIHVFDKKIFNSKKVFENKINKFSNIKIEHEHIAMDFDAYRIRLWWNNLNEIILSQNEKQYRFYGIWDVVFFKEALRDFDLQKEIKIEILSSKTLTWFSHDFYTNFYRTFSGKFLLN